MSAKKVTAGRRVDADLMKEVEAESHLTAL
jgi:hypothetical protein